MLERIALMRIECGENGSIADVRRRVLMTSIFGVDLNPMAVWLCELRLWLSMIIESRQDDPFSVPPLPNLDHHIRVGDALSGASLSPLTMSSHVRPDAMSRHGAVGIASLRARYVRRP